jgi:hypothetical protein
MWVCVRCGLDRYMKWRVIGSSDRFSRLCLRSCQWNSNITPYDQIIAQHSVTTGNSYPRHPFKTPSTLSGLFWRPVDASSHTVPQPSCCNFSTTPSLCPLFPASCCSHFSASQFCSFATTRQDDPIIRQFGRHHDSTTLARSSAA